MNHYYFEFLDAIKFVKHELNKDPEVAKKNNLDRWILTIIILVSIIFIPTIILLGLQFSTVKPIPMVKPKLIIEQILLIEIIGAFAIAVIMVDKYSHLKINNNILKKMYIEKLSAHLDSCNYTNNVLLKIKSNISDNENRTIKKRDSSLKFFTSIVFGIFVAILPGTAVLISNYVDEKMKVILGVVALILVFYIFILGYILIKEYNNINMPDRIQKIINSIDEVLIYREIKIEQMDKSKNNEFSVSLKY